MQADPFNVAGLRPLRALKILSCSTKLSRLDVLHRSVGLNTNVSQLEKWREEGVTAEWIHSVVRQNGELPVETAADLIAFLVEGAPKLRAILSLLQSHQVLLPPEEQSPSHRKMLIVESCLVNAWFLEVVLNAALVGTRAMHSHLNNAERHALVDKFNEPKSALKVMVITYDIGSTGLNLHKACNLVVLAAPGNSRSQEAQAFGQCLRVWSLFQKFFMTRVDLLTYNYR